jgi:hypothetical protein
MMPDFLAAKRSSLSYRQTVDGGCCKEGAPPLSQIQTETLPRHGLEGAAPAMMMIMRIPLKTAPSGDDDDAPSGLQPRGLPARIHFRRKDERAGESVGALVP